VGSELVDTPDGIRVSKLARSFRARKFMEPKDRSYYELNFASLDALVVAAYDSIKPTGLLVLAQDSSFILHTEEVENLADSLKLCTAK
jgi:hypothetical protein